MVYGGEFIIPIATFGLFLNGKGGVEQAKVFEIDLFDALQFDDKALTGRTEAVEVKNDLAVSGTDALVFVFSVGQLRHLMMGR